MIRVDVSVDGEPGSVLVLKSSGHALLDDAAASAVRQWRFVPATRDNVPMAASADVPIEFKLPH
jgi:protein TonB